MSKVLITGGAGYVGSVLCGLLLDKGHAVRVIDNLHKGNADSLVPYCLNPNFTFFRGDITHSDEVKRAMGDSEYIIHLAAIVGFPDCARAPGLAKTVNIDGTENVLRCKQKGVKLLFASTGSVYGKVEGICTENSPLNAVSLYGVTKIQAENMVLAEEDTVAFRFATGFGVSPSMRVNLLVNDLVYQAVKTKSLTIFQADFRRTFIHVRDMANLFSSAITFFKMFSENKGKPVYNAGYSNNNWTKRQLAEYISSKTDCHLSFAEIGQDADQRDYEVDYSKLENLGWKARTGIAKGVDELIKACDLFDITEYRYR